MEGRREEGKCVALEKMGSRMNGIYICEEKNPEIMKRIKKKKKQPIKNVDT